MVQQFRTKLRNRSRGQTMVEFALAFPIFLVLVIGIMEFGRLFITYTSVYAAAREGARYGAAVDNLCNDQIEAEAERAGFIAGDMTVDIRYEIYNKDLEWVSGDCAKAKAGDRVIVTASVPFDFISGYMPGGSLTVSSTAKRTIIKDVYLTETIAPASTTNPDFTPGSDTATPDETLTETATENPACSSASITGWTSGTSPYTVTLYNSGATHYDLTSVTVYWDREDNDLVKINLSGETSYWQGTVSESPATIDLTTFSWVIENGQHYMTLTFEGEFNNAQFNGVEINLTAADGTPCTIP